MTFHIPKKTGSVSNRGFASMDAAKQRAIASKGGQSVPNEKRSFSQDRVLAAQAGRKGGQNVKAITVMTASKGAGNLACLTLWTRNDPRRFPFLRVDQGGDDATFQSALATNSG
ncbi:MAG: general stress protein [Rhodomicrobium sp.]